jgi:small subunit ribosomal protein S6
MRKYESIFILDADLEEEQTQSVIEKVKGIVSQNSGETLKVEDWGKRKLAYQVRKKPRGHYFLIHFMGSPILVSELERNFRVMDAVIKFQTVRLDESHVASSEVQIPEEPIGEESEVVQGG